MNMKKILVVLLTLTMLTSAFAPTLGVFATELQNVDETPEKETINYVSLGDSMTNGYGLDGYEFKYHCNNPYADECWYPGYGFCGGNVHEECTDPDCTEPHYIWGDANGFRQIAWDAYPNLFAEYLRGLGNTVNHEQLAMAGMTSDMMRWILEFPINPEDPNHDLAMEIITKEEWSFVECDDETHTGCGDCLMSNGKSVVENWKSIWNFGDFHTFDQGPDSARMEKFCPDYVSPELYTSLGATGDTVAEYINIYQNAVKNADVISLCIGNGDFGNHMLNRIMWLLVGATDHELRYDMDYAIGSLTPEQQEFILDLEKKLQEQIIVPDVSKENSDRVIECMLYTTMAYVVNFDGIMTQISKMNPDAEIVLLGMIQSMKGVTIRLEDGTFFPLGDIMDECIKLGNMYLAGRVIDLQENDTVSNDVYFAEADASVEMIYENYSTEVYRPENLVVRDRFFSSIDDQHERILDYLGKEVLGDLNADFCDGHFDLDDVKAYENAGYTTTGVYGNAIELYLGFEKAIVEAGKDGALTIEGLSLVYGDVDEIRKPGYDHVKEAILDWKAGNTDKPLRDVVADALLGNINTKSVMYQYCRMNVGNFLGNHPTEEGHAVLFEAVKSAYEEKRTPADKTVENVIYLMNEYYKEAYAYAYGKVVKTEYVDRVVTVLDKTLAALDLAADNVGLLGLTPDLEAEVLVEINAAIATLDDLRAALVNGDARTIEGLMALVDKLEADLDTHIANVKAILAQAGYDVENVLVPALLDAKARFEDEVVPVLFDMAEEFAWVAVDFLLTNIDEIYYNLPEIANTVYAKALEVAIMVQILVGDTVDYVVETAYDVYFLVYNTVLEYYDDVEAAIAEADRIVHELYTTLVTIDNRLGNPSKDFLDGKTIEEWANLFNELYHKAEGDVEEALAQLDVIIADLLVVADGEYAKALVVFNAILKGIGSGYDAAEDAVVVAGQIFSYVYDFVVEDLTLAELKATCDGLVDTIALTYENTKSVDAVGIAIYDYVLGLFDDTFTGDYQLTVDSLYVALGNATYGEELAELLHLGDKYHNFGLSDDYLDTLADADFVTVRLDNGEALSFAIEQFMSYDSTELDWSKHLDAEGQAALDRVLTSIETELRSTGAADQLAAALNSLADEYADGVINVDGEFVATAVPHILETSIYAYADAIDRLETVIANVNTLAPNATVVITGVQNPLDALDLSAFGLDIGEYAGALDYVVDIFNVQLVAIAYTNDNIIYVDSVDAADIYAALNVTCAHAYDDCEDTTCNICGETRVAPGHTYGDYVSNGDAKCGVDGTKTRTCSVCGKKDTVADTGSALEHDWTDWEVVKEPTNKEEGLEQRTCKLCGEIQTRPIPTKDNDWVWIVVGSAVVLAAAAAAGVVFYRKKKAVPATEENKK